MPVKTFAIDNLGPYNVVAGSFCRRILIQENYNSVNPPTADLQQFQPVGTGPVAIPKGTAAVFTPSGGGSFYPGMIAGQINTLAGAATVAQIESDRI